MPGDRCLARWLAEARALLAEAHGPQTGTVRVTIRNDAGDAVTLISQGVGDNGAGIMVALSPIERDILRVLADVAGGPLVAKVIAARLHTSCDGVFRALLRNLTEREPAVLEASTHGYRIVGEPGHGRN